MKASKKNELKAAGLPVYAPNRKQGGRRASHNLCTCGQAKAPHFGGGLGHTYKAGSDKNTLSVQEVVAK